MFGFSSLLSRIITWQIFTSAAKMAFTIRSCFYMHHVTIEFKDKAQIWYRPAVYSNSVELSFAFLSHEMFQLLVEMWLTVTETIPFNWEAKTSSSY